MIKEKEYSDYFLIIVDLIQWAKKKNILVGPGRGSSSGSIVCWATEITEIDSIKYELFFERFIDVNRTDLPDIDIDFPDDKRSEVKRYLEDKYGKDKVAGIATFAKFKGKLCIQDIARVFDVPKNIVDELKPLFIE